MSAQSGGYDETRGGVRSRITQIWDMELKQAVKERVGERGATAFTTAAVAAALGRADELGEAREYAQRVSNALALMSPEDDPQTILNLLEPPAWVEQDTWPWLSGAGRAGRLHVAPEPTPEVVAQPLAQPLDQPVLAVCPDCGAELVGGECWTCDWPHTSGGAYTAKAPR